MSNFPFDSTPSEPTPDPAEQPRPQPSPEGGEDFLGLEQVLGRERARAHDSETGPASLLPEISGEYGETEIAQLMGARASAEIVDETAEEVSQGASDMDPQGESRESRVDERDEPEAAPEPRRRFVPTRGHAALLCVACLCVWSLSQWDPSAGGSASLQPTAFPPEASPFGPAPASTARPRVQSSLEIPRSAVAPETNSRPVAVNAPLRARLTALLRLAASVPSTPGPRLVPGSVSGPSASASSSARPHRGRRSWRASLDLILAQSVGAQDLQMGDVLLGGGWTPLGPNSFVMRLNDRAPQGLGVLSGSALELSPDFPPSTPATAQAAPAWVAPLRAATLIQSAAPDAVSGPDEPPLPGPLRGIAPAPQGNRWTRPEIPTGAIAQATRLLTPGVGSVRATLHGGEVFEGRLHQVGMGQIWIDTRLGRMSLESHRLARLETLESPGPARTGDRMGSRRLDQLTQVSVRVPGGLLTGALLDRKGNRVTLRIADGLQITVTSEDVRPLSDSSATLGVRPRGAGQRE